MRKLVRIIYNWIFIIIGSIFFKRKYLNNHFMKYTKFGPLWITNGIIFQKIGRNNSSVPWPVSKYNTINGNHNNIVFDVENIDNFQGKGVYFQCEHAKIYIGKRSLIANNVALITANHDFSNIQKHCDGKDIVIGDDCWIGFNAVILPGVKLGNKTIVGAGAIVTKSFEMGNCVIAGNPAKIIRYLPEEKS